MIEFYLFVDPACKNCAKHERQLSRLRSEINCKTVLRFIPMISLKTVPMKTDDNQSFFSSYRLILDFKAATFQGARKGREFLLKLQETLFESHVPYDDKLVYEIAKEVDLDLEMFKEDRFSPLTEKTFKSDQQLMGEMNISQHGNLVIFDCDSADNGILVDDVDYSDLKDICNYIIKRESSRLNEKIKNSTKLKVL